MPGLPTLAQHPVPLQKKSPKFRPSRRPPGHLHPLHRSPPQAIRPSRLLQCRPQLQHHWLLRRSHRSLVRPSRLARHLLRRGSLRPRHCRRSPVRPSRLHRHLLRLFGGESPRLPSSPQGVRRLVRLSPPLSWPPRRPAAVQLGSYRKEALPHHPKQSGRPRHRHPCFPRPVRPSRQCLMEKTRNRRRRGFQDT